MTESRRKDDHHPDRPLDWSDTETLAGQEWKAPAAAPAAGQAGLAMSKDELMKLAREIMAEDVGDCGEDFLSGRAHGVGSLHSEILRRFAAPVAADTEQATDEHKQMSMSRALRTLKHGQKFPYDGPNANPAANWTIDAARGVLADLSDRRGIKWELEKVEQDVRADIVTALAAIIHCAAPLATPADAGAGMTDDEIDQIYKDVYAGAQGLALVKRAVRAAEGRIIARMSTSGAPVTAEPVATVIKKGADRQWMSENLGSLPDGMYSLYLATPAPARQAESLQTRDAIRNEALEEAAKVCEARVEGYAHNDSATVHSTQCAKAIRALKSMERAADAKGGQ